MALTDLTMRRVAIQGYSGCFHEEAARQFYSQQYDITPEIVECATFEGLYRAIGSGQADAAVMAIENSTSGGLLSNFDLLRRYPQRIKGEIYLPIHQNLMALPGQKLEDIKEVRTHYMAIGQTRRFFKVQAPWIRVVESDDTAKSAAEVAREGKPGVGAVASALAAEMFGLEILDDAITVLPADINKATLCFTLPHKPGSLAHILTILSFYDMNLTRIQSLPIPGKEWQYFFYADITFDDYTRYSQALAAVRPLLEDLEILGEYTSAL